MGALLAGRTPHASRRLMVRLAAARGCVVTDDALIFAMYGDADDGGPEDAVNCLRQLIWHLRQKLPVGAIARERGVGYRLTPEAAPAWARSAVDDAHVVLARSPADARRFVEMRA